MKVFLHFKLTPSIETQNTVSSLSQSIKQFHVCRTFFEISRFFWGFWIRKKTERKCRTMRVVLTFLDLQPHSWSETQAKFLTSRCQIVHKLLENCAIGLTTGITALTSRKPQRFVLSCIFIRNMFSQSSKLRDFCPTLRFQTTVQVFNSRILFFPFIVPTVT